MNTASRVAIYGRVSTTDGRQDVDNQLDELRRLAVGRCYRVKWDAAQGARAGVACMRPSSPSCADGDGSKTLDGDGQRVGPRDAWGKD